MNKPSTNKLQKVLATLLTIAALFAGQQAFATITDSITIKGKMETNGYFCQITSHWFSRPYGPEQSNIHDFNQDHFQGDYNGINFDMMLNGRIHFQSSTDYSDVMTGVPGLTVTLTSRHDTMWFYGAAVKTLDGTDVSSGWYYSISTNKKMLTITFESGITFGKIEFDYVPNAPMTSQNTTVTVPQDDYWVSDADHLPTPVPSVTYGSNNTPLIPNTDYTLSWSNNTSAGTGTVTVIGTGSYIGSVSADFSIRWANYSVHFDNNHSDATGTMENQNFTYNTAQNLTANGFSLSNYNFAGWNTAADGTGTTYADQQSVSNLTAVDGETVTLYAQWATTTYTIKYFLGGGVATDNPTTYNETTPTFTLNNPTRTGYDFAGWTGTGLTENTMTVTITQGSTGNRTYYAHWTPITYNITYDLDGGNVATANPITYTVETSTFTLNNPTKRGYTFVGWTGSNGTTPQTSVTIDKGSTGDRNYTANWTLTTYNLTYNLGGGTVTSPNPTTYNITTPTFTLNNPTHTDYTFVGWTGTGLTEPTQTVTITQGSTGGRTYTANWSTITSYVDASGTLHENIPAIVLLDGMTTLAEGTYVVNSNVNYTKTVTLAGNVTLILADGCTMSIQQPSQKGISTPNGDHSGKNLDIYGQSLGSGTLTINPKTMGIDIGNSITSTYTQHGGNVSIESPNKCIETGNFTLLGGTLQIECTEPTSQKYDIHAYNNISILGGQFQSQGNRGIAGSKIILGWTNPSDYIYAKEYPASVSIANGQALYYENAGENVILSGTLNSQQIYDISITGRTLRPYIVPITVTKGIVGHENGGGWNLIASPLQGNTKVENVGGLISNTATHYDLYRFNQEASLEWENYKATDNTGQPIHSDFTGLVNGRGYLYANSDDVTLTFDGASYIGNGKVALDYTESAEFAGWNLVGNPFADTVCVKDGQGQPKPYFKMNAARNELIADSLNSSVGPMEGIFVYTTTTDETVVFTSQRRRAVNDDEGSIVIDLSGPSVPEPRSLSQSNGVEGHEGAGVSTGSTTATVIDRAIVRFDEGQTLPKFQINENSTKIYFPQGGKDYAIVTSDGVGEMPLNFHAEENGQYTITVNLENVEMGYLHLIDNMNGNDVDLLVPEPQSLSLSNGVEGPGVSTLRPGSATASSTTSYTFTARTTDYESRFKLVFASKNEDGPSTGSGTFAFYSNGNWIISNEGEATLQVIDITGRILSSETVNGSVSKAIQAAPGVYVIRLINGDNVRTQKVVVK